MGKVTLKIFNPRAEVEGIPKVSGLYGSLGLDNLTGKKIAILNNVKPGPEMLQPYLERALKERIRNIEFRTWKIPYNQPVDVKEPKIREIAEYADGVIALLGD